MCGTNFVPPAVVVESGRWTPTDPSPAVERKPYLAVLYVQAEEVDVPSVWQIRYQTLVWVRLKFHYDICPV